MLYEKHLKIKVGCNIQNQENLFFKKTMRTSV